MLQQQRNRFRETGVAAHRRILAELPGAVRQVRQCRGRKRNAHSGFDIGWQRLKQAVIRDQQAQTYATDIQQCAFASVRLEHVCCPSLALEQAIECR